MTCSITRLFLLVRSAERVCTRWLLAGLRVDATPWPSKLGSLVPLPTRRVAVSRGLYRNVSFDLTSCCCLIVYEADVRAVRTRSIIVVTTDNTIIVEATSQSDVNYVMPDASHHFTRTIRSDDTRIYTWDVRLNLLYWLLLLQVVLKVPFSTQEPPTRTRGLLRLERKNEKWRPKSTITTTVCTYSVGHCFVGERQAVMQGVVR